ncbi:MAG: GyrI-like domain-containing protein [Tannerellaceae bacterium]|nr:GyrI-like domain-containing protein [Tannerellaceae bacterium]
MEENRCQSCGMPMVATAHFGTNYDQTPATEYCCFCYQNGAFTDNFTFEEFVADTIQFDDGTRAKEYKQSDEELMLTATNRLQNLKRWRTHQTIHTAYYHSVERVISYIHNKPGLPLTLTELAREAHISEYHFHRIFKAILNESPGEYIQRVRLEKAAFKLQTTQLPLVEIAGEVGYQTPYALSKAFKKRYGVTPSAYRRNPLDMVTPLPAPITKYEVIPEFRTLAKQHVICTRVSDPYTRPDAFLKAWKKLNGYISQTAIPSETCEYICISHDLTSLTRPEHCRIYACITIPGPVRTSGRFTSQTIEGGLYAVFTHKGPYQELEALYCSIYRYWLLNSNYQLRDTLHFEKYLNDPDKVSPQQLLTEIYIPVKMSQEQ